MSMKRLWSKEQIESMGGTGGKLVLLNSYTETATKTAKYWTADSSGVDYDLSNAFVKITVPAGKAAPGMFVYFYVEKTDASQINSASYIVPESSTTYEKKGSVYSNWLSNGLIAPQAYAFLQGGGTQPYVYPGNMYVVEGKIWKIGVEVNGDTIPVGTTIEIYGVKNN